MSRYALYKGRTKLRDLGECASEQDARRFASVCLDQLKQQPNFDYDGEYVIRKDGKAVGLITACVHPDPYTSRW